MKRRLSITLALLCALSCGTHEDSRNEYTNDKAVFTNPILPRGSSPCLIYHNNKYYYTQSNYIRVSLWCSESVEGLKTAKEHIVYNPKDTYYISGSRLYRTDGKWYIYYCSEGQDMSTRLIHVLKNEAEDPLEGSFSHKATIKTGNLKSIHPYVFHHKQKSYLFWSGYDDTQKNGIDVLRIYIAEMDTPWSISSKPSPILSPKYEWECQWISSNGLKGKKPTYVNEGPVVIHSRDSSKILLYFAASQTYTTYYCEGLAITSSENDLLSPASWTKLPEPVFRQNPDASVYGAGHLSFFTAGEDLYMLYQAYSSIDKNSMDHRSPRMEKISWDADGIPLLGKPSSLQKSFPEPYK